MSTWGSMRLALVAGSACFTAIAAAEIRPTKIELIAVTPDIIEKARSLRRKSLKDPDAATFEGEKAALQLEGVDAGDIFVCGWMNAKTLAAEGRQVYYSSFKKTEIATRPITS